MAIVEGKEMLRNLTGLPRSDVLILSAESGSGKDRKSVV